MATTVFPSSLMSGLSAMDTKASGRLGVLTITYYLWTTFIAVIVGIILVLIIHPGTGLEKDGHHSSTGPVMTSADALLDLIRLILTVTYKTLTQRSIQMEMLKWLNVIPPYMVEGEEFSAMLKIK